MKHKSGIQKKILINTIGIVLVLAGVLMGIMIYFMRSLTDQVLLETLQPMTKTAAVSVEGNLHMLADRLMLIGDDSTFANPASSRAARQGVLDTAKEGIEFLWLALYDQDGSLFTGSHDSPAGIGDTQLYQMMKSTENLVIDDVRMGSQGLEIVMGMPVTTGSAVQYLVGSYKYDVLNDVLSGINIGAHGTAFIINDTGMLMAHRDVGNVQQTRALSDLFGTGDDIQDIMGRMVQGQTGSVAVRDGGDQRFFCFAPIRGTHWSLAVTAPRSDFLEPANQAILVSVVITACLLVLAMLLTIHLARKIQRPLGRVTGRIAGLAQGDLQSPVVVEHTRDETEVLSRALGDTVQSVSRYTSELSRVLAELSRSNLDVSVDGAFAGDFVVMKDSLNQIVDFLNTIMRSLQGASQEVLDTSRQVSENAYHVQESSDGQSQSLAALQQETQSIAANVALVNEHTQLVGQLATRAVESLANSEALMRDMLKAMGRINSNSEEITKINKFLEDIASRTNLLSLNASVEAARAGAAGRGFAVVAGEVRELAAQSGDSSRRADEMIQNSQKSIREGSDFAARTADSLHEIMEVTREISRITGKLTEAVDAQSCSLEAITGQIEAVNQLAGENLDSSQASARASQTLTQQADSLQAMAGRFRLRKETEVDLWHKK